MNTPLLLIAWRRPHTLRQVIDAIRPVAPTRLFVACDGPNPERPGEAEKVAATRALIEQQIDWPCQIERFYSDVNQGCRLGVSRAITWFFAQVEEGIILEDDCVPRPTFFPYCATLLERYRHDSRVASIGGHNPVLGIHRKTDVVFSRYFECWGWATWRRAWGMYDDNMCILDLNGTPSVMKSCFLTREEALHWMRLARQILEYDKPSSWAYRFQLCAQAHNTVHAISLSSLVVNIGLDVDGTNCTTQGTGPIVGNVVASKSSSEALDDSFTCPQTTLPDREFDFAYAALHGIQVNTTYQGSLLSRIKKKVKSLIGLCTLRLCPPSK